MKLGEWREFKTLGEYYDFFKDIPDEKWGIGAFELDGKMCAIGLLGVRQYTSTHPFVYQCSLNGYYPATINDGDYPLSDIGDTPKERILNAIVLKESGILNNI